MGEPQVVVHGDCRDQRVYRTRAGPECVVLGVLSGVVAILGDLGAVGSQRGALAQPSNSVAMAEPDSGGAVSDFIGDYAVAWMTWLFLLYVRRDRCVFPKVSAQRRSWVWLNVSDRKKQLTTHS